jgi:DNA-binding NtrC family response regulator
MSTYFPTVPVEAAPRQAYLHSPEKLRPVALIVDDEPVITETLAAILNSNGLTAITALDGLQALETALAIPPEILITDLSMPHMDGLELAIEITRAIPDCEVILSSGHGSSCDLAERMSVLQCDFTMLVKPVHPADLLDEVFKLLRKRGRAFNVAKPFHSPGLYDLLSSARRASEELTATSPFQLTRRRPRPSDTFATIPRCYVDRAHGGILSHSHPSA